MKGFVALCCLVVSGFCWADNRIRTEVYNKERVYNVWIKAGKATLIQLEEGETLDLSPSTVLGLGDASAWDIGVRGNNLAFKPVATSPDTNAVIVTNKRTYAFEFLETPKGQVPTYILRFSYPDTAMSLANAALAAEAAAELRTKVAAESAERAAAARAAKVINTDYVWRGSNELLKPTAVYDDGLFTRVVYDHGGELPGFYKVLPDGTEALINGHVDSDEKNTTVLHDVFKVLRVRLGREVIEIVNEGYSLPKFNHTGSSIPGVSRTRKGEGK